MKLLSIIGARPQFIKASSLSREITNFNNCKENNSDKINDVVVHTGQHFDDNMSRIFFNQLQIKRPAYNLEINSLNHGAMTGRMLEKIEEVLLVEKPDFVLVYGDTNSTLAGVISAKKLHFRTAHVEAGLRSFNMQMPEEINRIVADRLSDILFCPTAQAVKNLEQEGFRHFGCEIVQCGDVMYDAALYYGEFAKTPAIFKSQPELAQKEFALATIHREENTDNYNTLRDIIDALNEISKEITIILPLHPRTKKRLKNSGVKNAANIKIIEPVGYLEILYLLKNCKIVITDSGGLQKEAFFFRKPCLTLRNETEWVELVDAGVNVIGGNKKQNIEIAYLKIKNKKIDSAVNLYGKGNSAHIILNELIKLNYHQDSQNGPLLVPDSG